MTSGSDSYTVHNGDTNNIYMVQLIAQGTDRLSSVSMLKQQADIAQAFYLGGFVIGIRPTESKDISIFDVMPNYPNPFNPVTSINYQLPVTSRVNLTVYDITGRLVTTLVDKIQGSGIYKATWNADNFASGIYFYKFTATDIGNSSHVFTGTGKMILVK